MSGILVEKNNIEKLSEAIAKFVDFPDKRKKMGNAAMVRVKKNFDQKLVVQGYIDFIKKILL